MGGGGAETEERTVPGVRVEDSHGQIGSDRQVRRNVNGRTHMLEPKTFFFSRQKGSEEKKCKSFATEPLRIKRDRPFLPRLSIPPNTLRENSTELAH